MNRLWGYVGSCLYALPRSFVPQILISPRPWQLVVGLHLVAIMYFPRVFGCKGGLHGNLCEGRLALDTGSWRQFDTVPLEQRRQEHAIVEWWSGISTAVARLGWDPGQCRSRYLARPWWTLKMRVMHAVEVSQRRRIVHRAPLGLRTYIADHTTPALDDHLAACARGTMPLIGRYDALALVKMNRVVSCDGIKSPRMRVVRRGTKSGKKTA